MESAGLTFSALLRAVLVLLFVSFPASGQSGMPRRPINDPTHPLSNDPRTPRHYDLELESRNEKTRRDIEAALKEANKASSAKPPRYDEAEQSYLRALKLQPKEARAYLGLGFIYAAQNQVDKTLTAFKTAIDLKPTFAEAHFNLGMVLFAVGKKDEAIKEYETLKNLDKELAKKLKAVIDK